MNRKLVIFSIFLVIIAGAVIIVLASNGKKVAEETITQSEWIEENDYLYDMAVYHLTEDTENTSTNREEKFFRDFGTHHGFGIKQNGNVKYAYMWIKEQAYYVEEGEYILSEESSKPYVFTFVDDKITIYTKPSEGEDLKKFISDMFPDEIKDLALQYDDSELNMDDTVKEYYEEVISEEEE